jgi:hypothetical protein
MRETRPVAFHVGVLIGRKWMFVVLVCFTVIFWPFGGALHSD